MTALAYSVSGLGARRGMFLPVPVGGGHTTPASAGPVTRYGHVVATGGTRVPAPGPKALRPPTGSTGGQERAEYLIPNQYVSLPEVRPVVTAPLQAAPVPYPSPKIERRVRNVARRPPVGGLREHTPWNRVWPNYTRGS